MRLWWPALVWAAIISFASTELFSGEHTSRIIIPILQWIFPSAHLSALEAIHFVIRKCGHVGEYFLFGLALFRGIRGERKGWQVQWAIIAIMVATGWAALDELHQAFTPSRGPSMIDVMIDCAGATAGQAVYKATGMLRAKWRGKNSA